MWFVWLFKLTACLPLRIFFRIKVLGKENKPKGHCILALNHGAAMDGTLVNSIFPLRRIYVLTSPKFFECSRLHRWELWQMGCRPSISPSEDIETMTDIANNLKRKDMIAFFSEGKIHNSVGDFMGGAVMLALRTGLPLIPVYLKTAPFYKGGTQISFGKPMDIEVKEYPTAKDVEDLNNTLRSEVIKLSETRWKSKTK